MADSDFTTLLKNIKVNALDNTRHTSLSASRKVYVAPDALLIAATTPYFVIVPKGGAIKWESEYRAALRKIVFAIVYARHWTPEGENLILGGNASPPDEEAELLIDALVRPAPYNDGIHITGTGSYATQANVKIARPASFLDPEVRHEYGVDGQQTGEYALIWPFQIEYEIWRKTP
jgi:hypothetical protein